MHWRIVLLCAGFGMIYVMSQDASECFPEENVPFNRSAELEDKVDLPLDAVDLDNYIELCTDGIPVDLNQTIRNLTRTVSEVCAEFVIDTGDTPCNSINTACSCSVAGNIYSPSIEDNCNYFFQRTSLSDEPFKLLCAPAGLQFDVSLCTCNYPSQVTCPTECAGDASQATVQPKRWGYDPAQAQCVEFEFTGCGGNDNNFATRLECEGVCSDPCFAPPDPGSPTETITNEQGQVEVINCDDEVGLYYAYNTATDSCEELQYGGCEGNRNKFESIEECEGICKSAAPPLPPDETISTGELIVRRPRDVSKSALLRLTEEELDDTDLPTFCEMFEANYPDAAAIVKDLNNITSTEIQADLLEDLMAEVDIDGQTPDESVSQTLLSRKKRFLFGLFTRPLKHTSVKIINKSACRRIEITVRVKCLRALFRRPTRAQATRLCNLVKSGIKKYWETNILTASGAVDYPVTVKVKESLFFSKKVVLKWYASSPSNPNWLRSFNLGRWWIPMWMKYRGFAAGAAEDQNFEATAAHEFGHDVLFAEKGLRWSWGHEGTSTIFGNTKSSTPALPSAPAPINLMWYYDGGDFTNYYGRLKASQSNIKALVNYATFRFKPFWCPGEIGAPCILSSMCNPPGICSWFRCVNCNKDSQCPSGKYCKGRFNPFIINTCVNKKPNGALCLRDAICASGKCDGGQCVECENDGDCPSNEYCANKDLPLILNKCKTKKSNGAFCLRDGICASGKCDGALCVECENDGDCPSGQWCKWKDVPLVLNNCVNKISTGGWCLRNSQCANGMCDGARCVECENDGDCSSSQYCKNKNIPLVLNKCTGKKCKGWCSRGAMCKSGNCRWFARCKKC